MALPCCNLHTAALASPRIDQESVEWGGAKVISGRPKQTEICRVHFYASTSRLAKQEISS